MKFFSKRIFRISLLSLLLTIVVAIGFTCLSYHANPVEASQILFGKIVDKVSEIHLTDGGASDVEAQLRADGCGELRQLFTGQLLTLESVTWAGKGYDGTPNFDAFYIGSYGGKSIRVYLINGKIQVRELCEDSNFGCSYVRASQAQGWHELAEGELPLKTSGNLGYTEAGGHSKSAEQERVAGNFAAADFLLANRDVVAVFHQGSWVRVYGNQRAVINTPQSEIENCIEQSRDGYQILVRRPASVTQESNNKTYRETTKQESAVPANIQPWLGTWSGSGMTIEISYSGGQVFVGSSPARIISGGFAYTKENNMGTPFSVELLAREGGGISATMRNAAGTVVRSVTFTR